MQADIVLDWKDGKMVGLEVLATVSGQSACMFIHRSHSWRRALMPRVARCSEVLRGAFPQHVFLPLARRGRRQCVKLDRGRTPGLGAAPGGVEGLPALVTSAPA
jgi:hypothetical protein